MEALAYSVLPLGLNRSCNGGKGVLEGCGFALTSHLDPNLHHVECIGYRWQNLNIIFGQCTKDQPV